MLFRLSTIQQQPALASGNCQTMLSVIENRTAPTTTPDQKPIHKLHVSNSFKTLNLHNASRGTSRIVPYLMMSVSPMHARMSIVVSRASRQHLLPF